MIKSHQANFLPFFESHIAPFVNELVQSRIPSIRQAGVCFVDDVVEFCGPDAAEAYLCFEPPSYRADLFRFCALYSEGGVYLDEDIVPMHPLEDIVSECSVATLGHDFPAGGRLAKQMKILAAAPGAS